MEEKQLNLNWDECPKESIVFLYGPDEKYICEIDTSLKFAWARLQIAKNKLEGYYFIWEGKRYVIKPDGSLPYWPGGLFSEYISLICKLLNYKIDENNNVHIPMSEIIDISKCPKNDYADIYDNKDKLICHTNDDLQFKWVCAQIKLKKLHGCYLIFRDQKIMINEYGCPEKNPTDLFEHYTDQLITLV